MINQLKEEAEIVSEAISSLFSSNNPIQIDKETVFNEDYQMDITGIKIYIKGYKDLYSFVGIYEQRPSTKTTKGKLSNRKFKRMYPVWPPSFDQGDPLVGLSNEWYTNNENEAKQSNFFNNMNEAVYAAIFSLLKECSDE